MRVGGCSWIQRNAAHPLIHSQDNWRCAFNAAALFEFLFSHGVTDVSTACLPCSRNVQFSDASSTDKKNAKTICMIASTAQRRRSIFNQIFLWLIWFDSPVAQRPCQTPPKSDTHSSVNSKTVTVDYFTLNILLILRRRRDFMAHCQSCNLHYLLNLAKSIRGRII